MNMDNTTKKTLSIRISTNGFCFCTYKKDTPSSLQYTFSPIDEDTSLEVNLKRAIEGCKLITSGTEWEIKAIIETAEYTAIPAEFDNRQDYKQFYRSCFPKSDINVEIMSNKLTVQGMTMIFAVERGIYDILQSLGDVTYYTPASILMGYITQCNIPEENYMFAYMHKGLLLFIPVKEGKIGVSGCFRNNGGENHLFYLLSIWNEQGFSQTDDTLYLCGDKQIEESQLFISRFIKNLKRVNPSEQFRASLLNRLKEIPFDLQALILCE